MSTSISFYDLRQNHLGTEPVHRTDHPRRPPADLPTDDTLLGDPLLDGPGSYEPLSVDTPSAGAGGGSSEPGDPQDEDSGQRGDEAGREASDEMDARDEESLPSPAQLLLTQLDDGADADRRRLRRTLIAAAIVHIVALFLTLPTLTEPPQFVGPPGKVYVMKQVRFQKPPAKAKQEEKIPDRKAKKIPIPDPTPDDPEPILVEVDVPEMENNDVEEFFFGIPEGRPEGIGREGDFTGDAFQVGNGIRAPVGIFQPQPRYTEEARQSRIQGVILLSAVIDAEGKVRNLKAIKGLPLGLTESALETVATWTYKPAVNGDGKPVPVHYHITVNFRLQ